MRTPITKAINYIFAFFGRHRVVEPALNEMEKEKTPKLVADSSDFTILTPKEIGRKEMYYPETVNRQVDELRGILKPRNFLQVCHWMKSKGLPSRFACLFYGTTGTGKTETVMQLAKQTGRDVMLIDTPSLRNKWLRDGGDCLKRIFAQYRQLLSVSKRAPILLFNEANELLGQREANIEHRFLYKIQFEQPADDVRALIWHSMIPDVPQSLAAELAHKYKFSGGQIENIARKLLIDTVLHGSSVELSALLSRYCDTEIVTLKPVRQRVGF